MAATKTDAFAWVSIPRHQPHDRQRVYARAKGGQPKQVTFYARPTPRWEGSSIVYDFQYFTEWAALEVLKESAQLLGGSGGRYVRQRSTPRDHGFTLRRMLPKLDSPQSSS